MHFLKLSGACIAATCFLAAAAHRHLDQSSSAATASQSSSACTISIGITASPSTVTVTGTDTLETITATRSKPPPPDVGFPPRSATVPTSRPKSLGARGPRWPLWSIPITPGASLVSDGRYEVEQEWQEQHRIIEVFIGNDNAQGNNDYVIFMCQYACQETPGCLSFFMSLKGSMARSETEKPNYWTSCQIFDAPLEPNLYTAANTTAIGGYNKK